MTEKIEPVLKDGQLENFAIRINGRHWYCPCGCNVFNKPNKANLNLFECNSCGSWYESED